MLKQTILVIAAAGAALTLAGAPITPEQALSRAERTHSRLRASDKALKLAHTQLTAEGTPAVYVFNRGDNGGYLVLSADDMAYPVLGYADSGNATEGNLAPAFEWWMGEYARQIEYAREKGMKENAIVKRASADMTPIAPQIKVHWNQGAPYYNMCPLVGTDRTYTGCVATAMAQVMKYWEYPERGRGSVSYECDNISKRLSMDFTQRKFDWENMLDNYVPGQYNDTEAQAVAYLMKAAGYSVKMSYGLDSSGALAMNISAALKRYFNYDGNMAYEMRAYYSTSQWEKLLYDNLRDVGPILYGGGSLVGGGHSFVCDGYDGNGMFHFNWGWSGMSDGYFSLDALNPDALGTGGGSGGGYNFTQDAILGIQPPTGKPVVEQPRCINQTGSLAGFIQNGVLYFDLFADSEAMWVNYNADIMYVQFGAIFERMDGTGESFGVPVSSIKFAINGGYGTNVEAMRPQIKLSTLNLADGKYKVTFASRETETEGADWVPVRANYGFSNSITLEKSGVSCKVTVADVARLQVVDAQITNTLYYGGLVNVKAKIRNDWDEEMTTGLAPAFLYEQNGQSACVFLGESIMVTVAPHSEIEREWTSNVYAMQGAPQAMGDIPLQFTMFNEMNYDFYDADVLKDVTMKVMTQSPKLTGGEVTLNFPSVTETLPDGQRAPVYQVSNPMEMLAECPVTIDGGDFSYNMVACVVKPTFVGMEQVEILEVGGMPVISETLGKRTIDFSARIGFSTAEEGPYYAVMLAYMTDGQYVAIPSYPAYFKVSGLGVGEIASDSADEADTEIYNLQGVAVGTDFDRLPAGIYIRGGRKIMKR